MIELGYCKILWFVSVSQINYLLLFFFVFYYFFYRSRIGVTTITEISKKIQIKLNKYLPFKFSLLDTHTHTYIHTYIPWSDKKFILFFQDIPVKCQDAMMCLFLMVTWKMHAKFVLAGTLVSCSMLEWKELLLSVCLKGHNEKSLDFVVRSTMKCYHVRLCLFLSNNIKYGW